jgi:prepilin-type N-terminal cleavage/methylation domain-containing protein
VVGPLKCHIPVHVLVSGRRVPHSQCQGFTLLEMVFALALAALLSVAVLPRLAGLGDVGVNQQAEQLRRDISRVQLLALGQAQRLRLSVTSTGYILTCLAPTSCEGQPVSDPQTGQPFVVTLSDGTDITGPSTLDFDSLGRPVGATGLLQSSSDFTLARGNYRIRVVVLPLTGFARVLDGASPA